MSILIDATQQPSLIQHMQDQTGAELSNILEY